MMHDWPKMAADMSAPLRQLRGGAPEVMTAFSAMAKAANAPGALDPKTKELISLALAVAARCDACITFHASSAVQHGATRAEVVEAVGMAIFMGAGPAAMYAAQALEAFDQYETKKPG